MVNAIMLLHHNCPRMRQRKVSALSIPLKFRGTATETHDPRIATFPVHQQRRPQRRRSDDQGNHASAPELYSKLSEIVRGISMPSQLRVDRRRSCDNASVLRGSDEGSVHIQRLMQRRAQSLGSYNQNNHASAPDLFSQKSDLVSDSFSLINTRAQRCRSSTRMATLILYMTYIGNDQMQ
jgi:hypothetical protein